MSASRFPRLARFGEWAWRGDGPPWFGMIIMSPVLVPVLLLGCLAYGVTWTVCTAMGRDVPGVMKNPRR